MLWDVHKNKRVDHTPHSTDYRTWVGRLSPDEIEAIRDELNGKVEGDEVHTSSWMPGSDWTGTVFMPIYEKACRYDEEAAARCFGIMLWEVLRERDDYWGFGRYEKDGVPIEGMTYFRVEPP